MDIKAKITEIVDKVKSDPSVAANFTKDPVSTVEKLIGMDLPNDQINGVVDAEKAKLNLDKAGGALGGLGKLFGK